MADHCLSKYADELNNYDGQDFDRIRKEIIQKDKELLETSKAASRENVISNAIPPAGNNIGRKSTYTNMGLIFNELNKKKIVLASRVNKTGWISLIGIETLLDDITPSSCSICAC